MSERGTKRGLVYNPRILVTGDTGLLANNTVNHLKEHFPQVDLILPQGSKFFDLTKQNHTKVLFDNLRKLGFIDYVIHMAALRGSIEDAQKRPASYAYQNSMMLWNIIEECAISRVKKVVLFMESCSYPGYLKSPVKEEDLWGGISDETTLSYSIVKKMEHIAALSYTQQLGLNISCLILPDLFGPYDNFSNSNNQAVSGMIKRFIEAREEGYGTVVCHGSERLQRDLLFASDVGMLIPYFLRNYKDIGPMNISSGKGISMAELVEIIASIVGYKGKIHWDRSKPNGSSGIILDNTKLINFLSTNDIQWKPESLESSIYETVAWYEKRGLRG